MARKLVTGSRAILERVRFLSRPRARLLLVLTLLASCNGTTGTLVTLPESVASGGTSGAGGAPDSGAPDSGMSASGMSSAGAPASAIFQPTPGIDWQIQLSGTVDTSVNVPVYEVDLFDTDATLLADLHAQDRKVACYISVGTDEHWRADSAQFPAAAIGNADRGYAMESWLDVRDATTRTVMGARLMLASNHGCDAVELSNLDGYENNTGFPLTLNDELDYARILLGQGHALGLSIGLSSSDELVTTLSAEAEFGLTQGCLSSQSCAAWQPFISAGKAVFLVEFGTETDAATLCPQAKSLGFSLIIKHSNLDAFRVGCGN